MWGAEARTSKKAFILIKLYKFRDVSDEWIDYFFNTSYAFRDAGRPDWTLFFSVRVSDKNNFIGRGHAGFSLFIRIYQKTR